MREKLIYILSAIVAILFVRNLYVILTVLPDEANQGAMYRIMFFHIPAWWTAGLALTLAAVLVSGILWTEGATALALRGPLLAALRNE